MKFQNLIALCILSLGFTTVYASQIGVGNAEQLTPPAPAGVSPKTPSESTTPTKLSKANQGEENVHAKIDETKPNETKPNETND